MTRLFTKTQREAPKDEASKNAKLLIRAGFIHKEMAGVYSYLPLGLKVIKKIENIIREEMNTIGGQEVLLTTLQDPAIWRKSGRWDNDVVDNWFKTKLVNGQELGVANTHEEPLTHMLTHFVNSHKDLPLYIYQFQTKFRNELRAKSGIMRGREFLMKDMYSFSRDEAEFRMFYEQCSSAYLKIFDRVGIGNSTYKTLADGGSFTCSLTHEFQTITDAGEDIIYLDEEKKLAINKEVYTDDNVRDMQMDKNTLKEAKSIEVANIFPLGTKYAELLGLYYTDEQGEKRPVYMGSYGIGLGRLMGAIVEILSDECGLIWPKSVAPFMVYLIGIGGSTNGDGIKDVERVAEEAHKLSEELGKSGVEVLHDDRAGTSIGEKFADADLMGIPYRVVLSAKTLKEEKVEVKVRQEKTLQLMSIEEFKKMLHAKDANQ